MANFWSTATNNSIQAKGLEAYAFVAILVDTQLQKSDLTNNADTGIYLSTYHDNVEIDGNEYVADLIREVGLPPVTGAVTQEVQSLTIAQQMASFGDTDLYEVLGDNYHQASIIMTSYPVDASGALLIAAADVVYRSDGIIKQVARDVTKASLQIDFSNSYGQLNTVRELRTTVGSMRRLSSTDTTFQRAAAIDPQLTLAWGTNN